MATKRINALTLTATEADLVAGNHLVVDTPEGTKRLPANSYLSAGDITEVVGNWLEEHPEATTTVEDDSITDQKLHPSIKFNRTSNQGALGYKLLNKNGDFIAQVASPNTIYEVRDSFDLGNGSCEIPSGCILFFNGGRVSNGKLIGDGTLVIGNDYQIFYNTYFVGKFIAGNPRCEWFGGAFDSLDNTAALLKCLQVFGKVCLFSGTYHFLTSFTIPDYTSIQGEGDALTEMALDSDIDFITLSEFGVEIANLSINVKTPTYTHKVITISGKQSTAEPKTFSKLDHLKLNACPTYAVQFDSIAISFESNARGLTELHVNEIHTRLFGIAYNFETQTNGWINENKFTKIYVRSCPCAIKMRVNGTNTQIVSNNFEISYQNDVNFFNASQPCIIDVPVNSPSVFNNNFKGFFWDVRVNPDDQNGGVLKSVGFNGFGLEKSYFAYQTGSNWSLLGLVPSLSYGVAFDVVLSVYYNVKYRFQFTTILESNIVKLVCNKCENLTSKAFSSLFEFRYVTRNDTIYLFMRKSSEGYYYREINGQGCALAPYAQNISELPLDSTSITIPNGDTFSIASSQKLRVEGELDLVGINKGLTTNPTLSDLYSYAVDNSKPSGFRFYTTTAARLGLPGTELILLIVNFTGMSMGSTYGAGSSFLGIGGNNLYRGKIDLTHQTWLVTKMTETSPA